MAISRYRNRRTVQHDEEERGDLVTDRGRKKIKAYTTPSLRNITPNLRKSLIEVQHIWSHGDRYWKLASQHYNNPKYCWVIAHYNLKPTDSHCKLGDVVLIPKPIDKVLKYFGYQ